MHRLPGNTQSVTYLLPRPALLACRPDMDGFHLLGQAVKGTHSPQSDGGVGGVDLLGEFISFHAVRLD